MSLLDARAWAFPGWLDRLLPNVDVEGEELTRLLGEGTIPAQRVHESDDSGAKHQPQGA
jgi:hypothetical protein